MANEVTILLQIFLIFWLSVNNSLQLSDHMFTVDREYRDSFPNPDCDSTVCPNICPRYHASCDKDGEDTYPCPTCYCETEKRNFAVMANDESSCVTDQDLVKDSMPKEGVLIRDRNQQMFVNLNLNLNLQDNRESSKESLWIYTPDYHFMNMNRLNCLGSEPKRGVMVFPCNLSSMEQKWYLDAKGFLYNNKTGLPMYIRSDLSMTQLTGSSDNFQFKSERPTQVEYKGCYRFNDGSFKRDLDSKDNYGKTFTTIKILAPIYEENSKCFINWKTSSYMVNNKPWQYVQNPDNDITTFPAENSRGIYMKIPITSYRNWTGTILKLEVNCSSETTSEEHCVLIKFRGVFEPYNPSSKPVINPRPSSNDGKKSKHSNPYKISTIVLSVLIFIILVSIVVYFAIQSNLCKKLTRQSDHHSTSAEIPFCAETDREPEM